MKRLILVLVLVFSLGILSLSKFDFGQLLGNEKATYSVYMNEYYHDLNPHSFIKLGFATQVFVDEKVFSELEIKDNVIGKQVSVESSSNFLNYINSQLGIVVVNRQFINGYDIIYGYSKKLDVDAIKGSNIQIATKDNMVIVGSPIIFGEI